MKATQWLSYKLIRALRGLRKSPAIGLLGLYIALFPIIGCDLKVDVKNNLETRPIIAGSVPLLKTDSDFQKTKLDACPTPPEVGLFDVNTITPLADNPLALQKIDASAQFNFDVSQLKIDLTSPTRYLLKVKGCNLNLERLLTNFKDVQPVTNASTLLAKMRGSKLPIAFEKINGSELDALTDELNQNNQEGAAWSLSKIYLLLNQNQTLKQQFSRVFLGANPNLLLTVIPEIQDLDVPKQVEEKSATKIQVKTLHWRSQYPKAFEWWVEDQLLSSASQFNYVPPANSKPKVTMKLIIGAASVETGRVNTNLPHEILDIPLEIKDQIPVTPPSISLAPSLLNPRNNSQIELQLETGTFTDGVFAKCESFSSIAIKEGNEIPAPWDFLYSCMQGPTQLIPYTLIDDEGDGEKILSVYSLDSAGLISSPKTLSVTIDRTPASIIFKNFQLGYQANRKHTFSAETLELHSSEELTYEIEFFDGESWIKLLPVTAKTGSSEPVPWEFSHLLPDKSINNSQFRISFTDLAGNTTTVLSPQFSVQRPSLKNSPTLIDFGRVIAKSTGPSQTMTFSNLGSVIAENCGSPTLSGDHADSFQIVTSSCSDSLPPNSDCELTLSARPSSKGPKSATVTFTCENDTVTGSLVVIGTNNNPVAPNSQTFIGNEDETTLLNLLAGTDIDNDSLIYTLEQPPQHGVLQDCLQLTNRLSCKYVPNADYTGTDFFTYKVFDGSAFSTNTARVDITLNNVNDAPVVGDNQSLLTAEDTSVDFVLNVASDIDRPLQVLSYKVVSPPSHGLLTNCISELNYETDMTCTYQPDLNYFGTDSFTYLVYDGIADSTTQATVTISISPTNDPPVVGMPQTITAIEDTPKIFTITSASDIDIPLQILQYRLVTLPTKGTLSGCIDQVGYTTQVTCTYTPFLNANGTDSFTYKAYDGIIDSVTNQTVTLSINPINDPPTLPDQQSISTDEDTPLSFNLNLGSDIEGDILTYIKLTNPANGSLSCLGGTSRSCSFTPASNFVGTTSFEYKVNDGNLDSNTATVTVTINPVNDAPTVGANQTFNINDNSTFNFTLNSGSDIDLPAQALRYKLVSGPAQGVLSNCINSSTYSTDLTCTFTSPTNYHGTITFTYLVNDSLADSVSTATVTFNVTDVTPPSAPLITLASNPYTNVLSTTYTASSCTDTPYIFFNEGSAPLTGAVGWQACSSAVGALAYTLSNGAGTKTVKAWSKDTQGNVSTSATSISLVYETTAPSLAITSPSYLPGGATNTLSWTVTEANITTSQNFVVEYFNGSTWSTIGTMASTNGPLSTTPFSFNWSTPAVNITTAKVRVSLTDRAGNTGSVTSAAFTIDSIPPSLTISTPSDNTYYPTTSTTITGTCEGTLPITFSGDLQSSFTINCNNGSFSQVVNFSNNDGQKVVNLKITDLAGNQTQLSRTLYQDRTAPYLTRTTGANPQFSRNNTVTWGGTCEGNLTINYSGSSTGSFSCTNGTWSWSVPSKTTDGYYSYTLTQVDYAGNLSTSLSLAWTRDNVAPNFTLDQGTSGTNNFSSMTFSGACEGILPITVSGTQVSTFSCNNGSWSFTTATYSTDATRSFTFTQTDSASNSTARTYSWTRNTQGPALFLDAIVPIKSNLSTATFGGTCQTGLTINISGAATSSTTCNSGTWSWTTPSTTTDGTRTYTFSQTNAIPNTTSVSRTWYRKTTLPTVSAFTTSASYPSRNATIKTSISTASGNANVYISDVCTRSDDTTTPTADDICWEPVSGPIIARSPASTMTITNYPHLLGWETRSYNVFVWSRDEAGNISTLTSAGTGTTGTDKLSAFYDPGIVPVVADVWAANTPSASNPPTIPQASVPAGSDVYIHWKVTDNAALPTGAISLYFTENEITFNPIGGASALNNQNYGCTGLTLGANEGCFKWTGGSPLSTAYKVQVVAKDLTELSAKLVSNPVNTGQIKILAGNTESGLGSSAQSALFFTRKAGGESDIGSLVVSNDGRIFFSDVNRGILTVDPNDGNQKVFIPMTGTSSGDGGPAANATIRFALKIALDFQNRLLIFDANRIRRVDLNLYSPTIETIIGGGTDTSDTVNNATDVQIYSHSWNSWTTRGMVFFATPNGDIYFHSDYAIKDPATPTYRLRVFKAATGQVISKYFSLTNGDYWAPSTPIAGCRLSNPGLAFDPLSSDLTGVTLHVYHHASYTATNCDNGLLPPYGERYSRTYFRPDNFNFHANLDEHIPYYHSFHVTGMNGKLYQTYHRSYSFLNRVNFDGTQTRILGTGRLGQCADGTPAASCNMDLQDAFITAQDKIYFVDGGLIRTLDQAGNVITLFGQRRSYGDGVNALNARFDSIYRIDQRNNGQIVVGDSAALFFKEFTIAGNINVIAGNGNWTEGWADTTNDPKTVALYETGWFVTNPANGDIYARSYADRIARLNRATGLWERINTCGSVYYWDLDGQSASNRLCNYYSGHLLPLAMANNKLLMGNMNYNFSGSHWFDFMWKTWDLANNFVQSHVAGTNDPTLTFSGGYWGICSSGSTAATCKMPYISYAAIPSWDSTLNRWIFIRVAGSSPEIYGLTPGGTLDHIATLAANANSYVYVREAGTQIMYYCTTGGRLRRHNMATNADMGELNWPMSNMYCKGGTLLWNSSRRAIIFPFTQNGLDGVGEYYVPTVP